MRTTPLRLILIDEDTLFAATLAEVLRDAGYRITGVATSWASAARLASESHPEIAVVHAAQFPGPGDPAVTHMLETGAAPLTFDRTNREQVVGHVLQALALLEFIDNHGATN
jgi:AmiR/NasT family two-component response regulator